MEQVWFHTCSVFLRPAKRVLLKADLSGTAFRVGISPDFSLLSQRDRTDVLQELLYELFSCASSVRSVAECICIIYNDGGSTWK